MKNRFKNGDNSAEGRNSSNKNLNRNKRRLGGSGLSLETFAGLKSKNNNGYNPAIIKKQREFYKNAKYVNKYKRVLKTENITSEPSLKIEEPLEDGLDVKRDSETAMSKNQEKKNKHKTYKLNELYEQKKREKEKARAEREAIYKAKEEARKEAESRRKTTRKMMFKKTRSGQPVMKYRVEQLLESIQGSSKK